MYVADTQGKRSTSLRQLKYLLKNHLKLKRKEKCREDTYGGATKKSIVNKIRFVKQISVGCLLH